MRGEGRRPHTTFSDIVHLEGVERDLAATECIGGTSNAGMQESCEL